MEGDSGGGGGGDSGVRGGIGKEPILKIVQIDDGGQSAEQQLAVLRELKHSLVGDEKAKRSALDLFVVRDVLALLDAAGGGDSGGGHLYESSLIHGIGLLTILCSCPLPDGLLAEVYLAPSGSRIVRHFAKAMEVASLSRRVGGGGNSSSSNSEKLTATVLRALTSLCTCLLPATTTCPDGACADEATNNEKLKTLAALKEISEVILKEIVANSTATAATSSSGGGGGGGRGRQGWPQSLTTLGLQSLAAMTRVEVKSMHRQLGYGWTQSVRCGVLLRVTRD